MSNQIETHSVEIGIMGDAYAMATDIVIETIIEKKPRKKWTAQNPRKKRQEINERKPSKYIDGLPFDDIRYKYNRTYYEKNREKMLEKMKQKYQSKSKKNKINNAINLLEQEGII